MFKYFNESVANSWKAEGFEDRESYIAYLQNLENAEIPERGAYIKVVRKKTFAKNPLRKVEGYTVYEIDGKPSFNIVDGHEMDSEWAYGVKSYDVGLPSQDDLISQAEYVSNHKKLFKSSLKIN